MENGGQVLRGAGDLAIIPTLSQLSLLSLETSVTWDLVSVLSVRTILPRTQP